MAIDRSLPLRRMLEDIEPTMPPWRYRQLRREVLEGQRTRDTAMDTLMTNLSKQCDEIVAYVRAELDKLLQPPPPA